MIEALVSRQMSNFGLMRPQRSAHDQVSTVQCQAAIQTPARLSKTTPFGRFEVVIRLWRQGYESFNEGYVRGLVAEAMSRMICIEIRNYTEQNVQRSFNPSIAIGPCSYQLPGSGFMTTSLNYAQTIACQCVQSK